MNDQDQEHLRDSFASRHCQYEGADDFKPKATRWQRFLAYCRSFFN
jgi:hypothetical protein